MLACCPECNGQSAAGCVAKCSNDPANNGYLKPCSFVTQSQIVTSGAGVTVDLDMSRVGMFGERSGGSIGILAAAVDPRIKVLDVLNPWGDWPEWMTKSTRIPEDEGPNCVKPEFLKKFSDLILWIGCHG